MLRGQNIVCISTISWEFLWQGHQAISSILARAGNRVIFIENTGVRAPRWRDRGRIVERLAKWLSGRGRFGAVEENITLYSPLAIPFPYSRFAQLLNRQWICRRLARELGRRRFDHPILFTYLPTQFTLDVIDAIDPALTVFYCTDKLSESSPAARRLVPYEKRLLERSDLVFASAEKLAAHCRHYNPETHLVPTGVSLEKFDSAWRGEVREPADLTGLPRPLIGYVGGLRKCVDQSLLRSLSVRFPMATLVLVGPEQVRVDSLKALPNVRLLGSKPHADIPAYVRHFDVCLIPYLVDGFTDHISPAKLNEYLAIGKPVVSTGLFEVRRFVADHGDVIAVADGIDGFTAKVEAALREDTPDAALRRRAVAEANSWQAKVEDMSARIESKLIEKRRARAAHR